MMNRPIEGIVTSATLRGRLLGHSFYRDVAVRRRDGGELRFSRLTASSRLEGALGVGSAGRFHFHDIVGAKGLHGFAGAGAAPVQSFPKLIEAVFATVAVLNLAVAGAWITSAGMLPIVPLAAGVLGVMAWATCRGARQAILHDLKYENRLAARRTHRDAVMHSHA